VWSRTLPDPLTAFALDANGNVVIVLDVGFGFTLDGQSIHGLVGRAAGIAVLDGETGFASQLQGIGTAVDIATPNDGSLNQPKLAVAADGDFVVSASLFGKAIVGGQTFVTDGLETIVTRVSPAGQSRFAVLIAGSDFAGPVAVAPGDAIVISGHTAGSVTLPNQPPVPTQPKDSFIAALDGTGQQVLWSRLLGGGAIRKLAIRGDRLAVLGDFLSPIDLGLGAISIVPSPHPSGSPEPADSFVGVIATDTGQPVWARGIDLGGDQFLGQQDLGLIELLLVPPSSVTLAGFLQAPLRVADFQLVEPFGFSNGILLSLGADGSATSIARLGGPGSVSLNGIATTGSQLFGVGAARNTNDLGGVPLVSSDDVDGFILRFTPAATAP
jgi:hypothetical protein